MGVDFHSYSNVCIKPIPTKYRAKKKKADKKKYYNIMNDETVGQSEKLLIMALKGIGYDRLNNDIIIPDVFEISEEAYDWRDELEELRDDNFIKECNREEECKKNGEKYIPKFYEELIMVNWHKDIMYYTTEETKRECCSMSYSYFSEFIDVTEEIYGSKFPYIIPDTDRAPYYGFVTGDAIRSLKDIFNYIKENYIDKEDKLESLLKKYNIDEYYLEQFNSFCIMLNYADENGGICVS